MNYSELERQAYASGDDLKATLYAKLEAQQEALLAFQEAGEVILKQLTEFSIENPAITIDLESDEIERMRSLCDEDYDE